MTALIDTHTFLWMVDDDSRLSRAARAVVKDPQNSLVLSVASQWEIAIKFGLGRLALSVTIDDLLQNVPSAFSLAVLSIRPAHLVRVASLPHHHRDPFDRLLVAQCMVEQVPILSADAAMDAYGVQRLW